MTLEEALAKISHLEGQLTEVRTEAADKRVKNKDLNAQVTALTGERDALQAKVGKPSELQARIDDLTGQLRTIKHRGAFEKVAAAAKVKPKALDSLWDSLKLKIEADEPDEKALQAAVDGAKESHDFYFDSDDGGGGTGTPPPAKPPQGGDRGGSAPRPLTLTDAQRRDPKFMHDNREAIAAAATAGTLR